MIGKPKRDAAKALIGPAGITANELYPKIGCAWQTASNILCDMARLGEIHRVKYSHKSVRFFATKAEAEQHQPKTTRAPVVVGPASRHKPANSTQTDITYHKEFVRTVHPTPPGRFEVPASFVGLFRAAGIGRYLEAA